MLLDNAISLKSKEDSAFAYHAITGLESPDRDIDDTGPFDLESNAVPRSGGLEHVVVFAPQHCLATLQVGHHPVDLSAISFWFKPVRMLNLNCILSIDLP